MMAFDVETHDWVEGQDISKQNIGRVVQLGWVVFDDQGNKIDLCL